MRVCDGHYLITVGRSARPGDVPNAKVFLRAPAIPGAMHGYPNSLLVETSAWHDAVELLDLRGLWLSLRTRCGEDKRGVGKVEEEDHAIVQRAVGAFRRKDEAREARFYDHTPHCTHMNEVRMQAALGHGIWFEWWLRYAIRGANPALRIMGGT